MPIKHKTGHPLKVWGVLNGMTQRDIADQLRVTKATVSSWVTGMSQPAADNMTVIARLTDRKVTAEDMSKWREENGL